ncbi:unknown [Choristoneura occidentalis granulovirus]|uniref:P40 n=1 Tax=Choristoneura occidentalis granulovirus TaxID=364745 RepID=Q1A4N0_9BBAC|nr:unknown [Choristoneura fumiferana granulovirus]ABC61200.1 unknown [Choristoneura fumiferana granulovirus]
MSSAKIRLFLTIEKLKNVMEDTQMSYPFWEKFFPLFGNTTTINLDVATLSELINEAAETAEQLIVTQGGAIFSQHLQNAPINNTSMSTKQIVTPIRTTIASASANNVFDAKKYHAAAEKIATYFVSASVSSVPFFVKDLVKLYLYAAHTPKFKHLYEMLEQTLFRKERECIPVISPDKIALILDNIRDITSMTSYRLDYESAVLMITNIQRALNNEMSRYPQVKVKEFISNVNVYEKEVKPFKALADKFELLVGQKTSHYVVATDNKLQFNSSPMMIENVATMIEKHCDMSRMVFNSINNIFINAVEQSAAENIKFNMIDYNKRFQILDRVRENSQIKFVEKGAVGDVGSRKRTKTTIITPPITLKRNRLSSTN